jgi:hypothetical protein
MDLSGSDLDSVTRTILAEAGENATPASMAAVASVVAIASRRAAMASPRPKSFMRSANSRRGRHLPVGKARNGSTRKARPTNSRRRCSRLQTQLCPPDDDSCKSDGSGEVCGELVIASGDTAPVLEPAKHSFDEVAQLVSFGIERMDTLAGGIVRDDGHRPAFG